MYSRPIMQFSRQLSKIRTIPKINPLPSKSNIPVTTLSNEQNDENKNRDKYFYKGVYSGAVIGVGAGAVSGSTLAVLALAEGAHSLAPMYFLAGFVFHGTTSGLASSLILGTAGALTDSIINASRRKPAATENMQTAEVRTQPSVVDKKPVNKIKP